MFQCLLVFRGVSDPKEQNCPSKTHLTPDSSSSDPQNSTHRFLCFRKCLLNKLEKNGELQRATQAGVVFFEVQLQTLRSESDEYGRCHMFREIRPPHPPNKDIVIFVSDTPVVFYSFVYPAMKKIITPKHGWDVPNVEAANKLFADKSPPPPGFSV